MTRPAWQVVAPTKELYVHHNEESPAASLRLLLLEISNDARAHYDLTESLFSALNEVYCMEAPLLLAGWLNVHSSTLSIVLRDLEEDSM